ncbi:MAG TPA: Gfo/Idh/MocA family oxidoreductase, partial [Opitutaceae bacterium]|nr:Gfo/Idh/MocA family oxidoreductase [Opitutaceae bacterium]
LSKGMHIYLEKPVSYDVREGRAMVEAAAKRPHQVVQVGFQRRQSAAFKAVKQFIADGNLGRVVQAEAQINAKVGLKDPTHTSPPPSLDWDLWCGPGPLIPYSQQVGHISWRLEEAYGQGHLYDWGIHMIDAARVILDLSAPKTIGAAGGLYQLKGRITTPDTMTAHLEYDRCPVSWRHRIWGSEEYTPEINIGVTFFGEKGTVWVNDNRWVHVPSAKGAERVVTDIKTDTGPAHVGEFLNAVRGKGKASCTIADAHLSTTAVKLAMIALKVGDRLTWDSAKEQIVGNRAASVYLKRDYRAPWKHPYVA